MKLIWMALLSLGLNCLVACQPQTPTSPTSTTKQASAASTLTNTQDLTQQTQASNQQDVLIDAVLEWEQVEEQIIRAPNNGTIEQLLIQEGQRVSSGQLLVQFKPSVHASNTSKRVTTSHVDQAAKNKAYQKWQEDKKLFAQGFISQAALAKSEAAYRAASKPVVSSSHISQTAPPQANTPSWIHAPFNGVIKPLTVSAGSTVQNAQQLFTITPVDVNRLKLLVAQDNQLPLQVGQRIHIIGKNTDIWLQISELPPSEGKQYMVAYAIWPTDLSKPDLASLTAKIVIQPQPNTQ